MILEAIADDLHDRIRQEAPRHPGSHDDYHRSGQEQDDARGLSLAPVRQRASFSPQAPHVNFQGTCAVEAISPIQGEGWDIASQVEAEMEGRKEEE